MRHSYYRGLYKIWHHFSVALDAQEHTMSEPTIKTDELPQSMPGDPPSANGEVSAGAPAQGTGTETSGASLPSPPASTLNLDAHEAQDAAAEAALPEVVTSQTHVGSRPFTW